MRFSAVDNSGVIINPLLFEGQIHGGIAQGWARHCWNTSSFDRRGQVVSGSFMDYAMPRAHHMPSFRLEELGDFCKSNPIGVKGAGESGTVGAPPAIIAAIVDALRDYDVTDIADAGDMPSRVWQADAPATMAASKSMQPAASPEPDFPESGRRDRDGAGVRNFRSRRPQPAATAGLLRGPAAS